MYGKHFESMYTGSMVGKGSAFFAVWGYVISHFRPSQEHGAVVELNPVYLGAVIGEKAEVVGGVIEDMCSPDGRSRSQVEEGRKLVALGVYDYRVVNGGRYRAIRNAEDRREYQRQKQAEYRARKKGDGVKAGTPAAEATAQKAAVAEAGQVVELPRAGEVERDAAVTMTVVVVPDPVPVIGVVGTETGENLTAVGKAYEREKQVRLEKMKVQARQQVGFVGVPRGMDWVDKGEVTQ
jgi:hypothetical protein